MSSSGTKRTGALLNPMSAIGGKADIAWQRLMSANDPKRTSQIDSAAQQLQEEVRAGQIFSGLEAGPY